MKLLSALTLTIATLCAALPAAAQEFQLGYTFLDFNFLYQETDATGTQTDAVINQTVSIATNDGAGAGIRGSLQLPARFFLIGEFAATVIDLQGQITNPIADVPISDDFSFRQARAGLGYAIALASDRVDLTLGVTYDHTNYDIGSIAGETFATDDGGIGARAGIRAKIGRSVELAGFARYTEVGKVDLNTRLLDSDTLFGAHLLYYVGPGFAFGVTGEFGEISSGSITLRYAFGRTGLGR